MGEPAGETVVPPVIAPNCGGSHLTSCFPRVIAHARSSCTLLRVHYTADCLRAIQELTTRCAVSELQSPPIHWTAAVEISLDNSKTDGDPGTSCRCYCATRQLEVEGRLKEKTEIWAGETLCSLGYLLKQSYAPQPTVKHKSIYSLHKTSTMRASVNPLSFALVALVARASAVSTLDKDKPVGASAVEPVTSAQPPLSPPWEFRIVFLDQSTWRESIPVIIGKRSADFGNDMIFIGETCWPQ